MYRKATDQEIAAGSAAISALSRWLSVKTHAHRWYGTDITKVELELGSESNDEGGSYYTINGVSCYRADGTGVYQNYEGPHWDAIRAEDIAEATTGRTAALNAVRTKSRADQQSYRERWPNRTEVYPSDETVELWVLSKGDDLDEQLAFWKEYDEIDADDRPALLAARFEDSISDDESSIELDNDGDDTTFDLTTRPTVPEFYVLVAE